MGTLKIGNRGEVDGHKAFSVSPLNLDGLVNCFGP